MKKEPSEKILKIYSEDGREPFTDWLKSIKDFRTQLRINSRIDRIEQGNFGDCEPVGEGVYELRMFFGSGYRVYFGEVGNTIVLLLCGGDKKTQSKDIKRAKEYWRRYNE